MWVGGYGSAQPTTPALVEYATTLWQVRLAIRALGNSYTTQGQRSAGARLLGRRALGDPHGQSKVRQDGAAGHRRNQVDGGGQAQTKNGYTCSRLHLGGEYATTCIQTARRWRLIIFSG